MYKALDLLSETEIIILSPAWRKRIRELRDMDRVDRLVCQGCRQPLRVRVGRVRRPHFAHKHLKGCSFGLDSPELLMARAVLYERLVQVFAENATLEQTLPGGSLPRPVDCWVRLGDRFLAYWIINERLKLPARQAILETLNHPQIAVTWVISKGLFNPDPYRSGHILLSPTERDFLKETPYDQAAPEAGLPILEAGRTLHYLDAERLQWITYRALQRVHAPNVFSGRRQESPLEGLQFDAQDGEPLHPGEKQGLQETLRKAQQIQADYRHWFRQRGREAETNQENESSAPVQENPPTEEVSRAIPEPRPATLNTDPARPYVCVLCGELTSDWWTIFWQDGVRRCKCRACLARGKT